MTKTPGDNCLPAVADAVFDIEGLGEYLKISPRTIWRKISTGEVPPPICIGRSKRWSRAAVDSWLADRAAKAAKGGSR
ncbi:MAG: helix-turn-helix domain-containing protein [Phycisphaerales bacterium]|nr:helix-turn-helix domain-containing protein [Phycisphaerales bacterium]MCG3124661.1 hypothetical protein [Phycisphaerales bacterium]